MQDETALRQKPDAPITRINKARTKKNASGGPMEELKKCASLVSDEIMDMLSDKKQFTRHIYQEKSTGQITEAALETRNVKHMREVIAAIRELADVMRSLYGLLSPEAESELNVQIKKLSIEEKKLLPPEKESAETGVVLLPEPEDDHA